MMSWQLPVACERSLSRSRALSVGLLLLCFYATVLPTVVATLVDDGDSRIVYHGLGWSIASDPDFNGGSSHRTNITGNQAFFNFTGTWYTIWSLTSVLTASIRDRERYRRIWHNAKNWYSV